MSHLNFGILAFSINFCFLETTCLQILFDRKLQVFKNLAKLTTQNLNVARFACNVECDLFCYVQTLWHHDLINDLKYKALVFKVVPKEEDSKNTHAVSHHTCALCKLRYDRGGIIL